MGFFSPAEKLLAPLTGTLTAAAAATNVPLGPVTAYRVKMTSTTGVIRWASQEGTADASNGYTLTATDPDSGWIPSDGDTALDLFATAAGDADYEIARLRRA